MPITCEQERIDEKGQQRKEDQAEYDRVVEEHRQRLATLAEDAQDAKLVCMHRFRRHSPCMPLSDAKLVSLCCPCHSRCMPSSSGLLRLQPGLARADRSPISTVFQVPGVPLLSHRGSRGMRSSLPAAPPWTRSVQGRPLKPQDMIARQTEPIAPCHPAACVEGRVGGQAAGMRG